MIAPDSYYSEKFKEQLKLQLEAMRPLYERRAEIRKKRDDEWNALFSVSESEQ